MSELTARRIETAKPDPAADRYLWDGDGLGLKVAPNGRKSFVYRYTYAGRRRTMTLGPYPVVGLADAREARRKQHAVLLSGKDPLLVRETAVEAKQQALRVREAVELWHDKWLAVHYKQPKAAADFLRGNLVPVIGDILVPDVEPPHVTGAINRIVERGAKVVANRTLPLAKKFFDWCQANHYRSADQPNPVTITRRNAGGQERSRSTVLEWEHICEMLQVLASDDHGLTLQTRAALQLVLATAKRPLEVVTLEWSEVDLARGTWGNPEEKTKMGHGRHVVFLNDFAKRILKQLWEVTGHTPYVFLSTQASSKHPRPMARHTLSQAVLDLYNAGKLSYKFTPHDLRRTFSTRMADLEIPPHVVEKILDHKMGGVMEIYNRATYYPQRKAAMDLWSQKLDQVGLDQLALVTGE